MRDVYPGPQVLNFTRPGSSNYNMEGVGKKLRFLPFFVTTNFTKLKLIFYF